MIEVGLGDESAVDDASAVKVFSWSLELDVSTAKKLDSFLCFLGLSFE